MSESVNDRFNLMPVIPDNLGLVPVAVNPNQIREITDTPGSDSLAFYLWILKDGQSLYADRSPMQGRWGVT